jgi:hypothetical protein
MLSGNFMTVQALYMTSNNTQILHTSGGMMPAHMIFEDIYLRGIPPWERHHGTGATSTKGITKLLVLPARLKHIKWAAAATHMSCCWAAGGVS